MSRPDLIQRRERAEAWAREAGALALQYFDQLDDSQIRTKGPHDVVSAADIAVENLLRQRVADAYPGELVLGEEQGGSVDTTGPLWVFDPIDGTGEFVRGSRSWCIVISFVDDGQTQVAVVYTPCADEMVSALRGAGATRNGTPISASPATSLSDGVVTVEHSSRNSVSDVVRMVESLLQVGGSFVREGSGALGICQVACGRSLGFIELDLKAWDCLGPLLIAAEAGCVTTDFIASGFMARGGPVVVAAPGVAAAVLALLPTWASTAQVRSTRAPSASA